MSARLIKAMRKSAERPGTHAANHLANRSVKRATFSFAILIIRFSFAAWPENRQAAQTEAAPSKGSVS
jgi:hypothetical protein